MAVRNITGPEMLAAVLREKPAGETIVFRPKEDSAQLSVMRVDAARGVVDYCSLDRSKPLDEVMHLVKSLNYTLKDINKAQRRKDLMAGIVPTRWHLEHAMQALSLPGHREMASQPAGTRKSIISTVFTFFSGKSKTRKPEAGSTLHQTQTRTEALSAFSRKKT